MSTSIETLEFNNHEGEALWSQFSRTDDAQGTLVFFHGFPGSSDYIVSQRMRDFSRNSYNVLRLDFSGSGRSKGKFQDKTMTKEAKEVVAAFEFATKLTPNLPVSLVGHSTGAIDVALSFSHFSSTLLEQIHSVILLGGVSDLKKGISYDFSEEQVKGFTSQGFITYSRPDHWLDGKKLNKAFYDEYFTLDICNSLSLFQGPVLVVHGELDESVPVSRDPHELYNSCSGAKKIEIIEGADHKFTEPKHWLAVEEAILSFLGHNALKAAC